MFVSDKKLLFAVLLSISTTAVADDDTECTTPVVEDAEWVSCLKEKDVFEAALNYFSLALVDKQGQMITGYDYSSLTDNERDGLISAKKYIDGTHYDGIIDTKGRTVVDFEYDGLHLYSRDLVCGIKDNLWGCFDVNGVSKLVTPYRAGYLKLGKYFQVFDGDYSGIIDLNGEVLVPLEYGNLKVYAEDLICGRQEKIWGCFNISGKSRFTSEYDESWYVFDKYFIVEEDKKFGMIDFDGNIIIPLKYDKLLTFNNEDLLRAKIGDNWGVVDTSDQIILPLEYEVFSEFDDRNTFEKISKGVKSGYINKDAEVILPILYDDIIEYFHNYAILRKNDKYGIADPLGNIVLPIEYDSVYKDTYAATVLSIKKNGKLGYVDMKGNMILPAEYNLVRRLGDKASYIVVEKNNQLGLVDNKTGKLIVSTKYEKIKSIKDGIIIAMLDGKYGYLNDKNQTMTDFEFDDAREFSDGMALVKKKSKWGYIDNTGRTVIEPQFGSSENFIDGVARVDNYGDERIIDKNGQSIIPKGYRLRGSLGNGLFTITKNYEDGIINKKGEIIVPAEYSVMDRYSDDVFLVKKEGRWGMINSDNNVLIPIEHKEKMLLAKNCIALKDNEWNVFDNYANPIFSNSYSDIQKDRLDRIVVKAYGKWGMIDCNGQELLPISFDKKPKYEGNYITGTIDGKRHTYNIANFKGGQVDK